MLHADVWRLACDELHVAKQRGNEHTRRTLLAAMTEPFDLICDVDLFIPDWHHSVYQTDRMLSSVIMISRSGVRRSRHELLSTKGKSRKKHNIAGGTSGLMFTRTTRRHND